MFLNLLEGLEGLAIGIHLAWSVWLSIAFLGWAFNAKRWKIAAGMHQNLWPFAFPGIVWSMVDSFNERPWLLILNAISFVVWWANRDWPDENPWKRRGRKAKESVTVRAGKLVIVPASN